MDGSEHLTPLGRLFKAIDGLVDQDWTEVQVVEAARNYYRRITDTQMPPPRPEERVDARAMVDVEW